MRPSLRSDSDISVSFDWKSSLVGMQVGWIWVKQGLAKNAPVRCARHIAVALHPWRWWTGSRRCRSRPSPARPRAPSARSTSPVVRSRVTMPTPGRPSPRGRASRCACRARPRRAHLPHRAPGRRRAAAAGRSGPGRRTCALTWAPPNERLSSSPPYSRAKGTPWATHWSMMFDAHLGEPVDVRLPGAEVAALHRVVEEAEDGVAVVLVVLRRVDAALGGDGVRPPRGVVEGEHLHAVAELGQRRRGGGAGEAGARRR